MIGELILASSLVFAAPTTPPQPRPPKAEFRKPAQEAPRATIGIFEESFVIVQGLEGRLMVDPALLAEYKLRSGQEIDQALMYQILERNQKLR